jgi:hypothetical protein
MSQYNSSSAGSLPERIKKGVAGKTDQLTERRRMAAWLKERSEAKHCMKGVKVWKNK